MKKAFIWIVVFLVIIAIVYSFTEGIEGQKSAEALKHITDNSIQTETRDFGNDGDEGGSVKQDAALIVSESIVAKWVSVDDAKFVRVFNADGSITDLYEGKETLTGSWKAVTKADGAIYIEVLEPGSHGEAMEFKVVKLTPDELELIYMGRGNTLRFTKIR